MAPKTTSPVTRPAKIRCSFAVLGNKYRPGDAWCARAGFTLLEMTLAIGLLLAVAAMAVVAMNSVVWNDRAALDEAATRIATAMTMARADAASQGKRIRLTFDADTGAASVLIEAKPLEEPGVFVAYEGCAWAKYLPGDLARVVRCQRTGPDAWELSPAQAGEAFADADQPLESLTFAPDGSSDSATLELAPAEGLDDDRWAIVELEGLSGNTTVRILTDEEYLQRQAERE